MAGAALLQDEAGNIDRVRMSDGRVFRIASTVATEAATEARSAAQRAQAAAAESSSATEELRRSQGANDAAQAKNGEAQRANDAAQLANNAAQMANNAAAKGLVIVQLQMNQYSESLGRPTVDGEPGRLYVVPAGENASDRYLEFMWIGGGWERIGSQSSATAEPITAEDIDAALDYGSQGRQGTQVLNLSGLTYLCRKLVEMFGLLAKALDGKAGSSHTHSASDVSSGVLPASRGGTGVQSAREERKRLGLGTTTGALPVANGGTGATSAAAARASLGAASSSDLDGLRAKVERHPVGKLIWLRGDKTPADVGEQGEWEKVSAYITSEANNVIGGQNGIGVGEWVMFQSWNGSDKQKFHFYCQYSQGGHQFYSWVCVS